MRSFLILFLITFVLFSCNSEKKQNNVTTANPKNTNAILRDKFGNPIPLPKDKLIILNFMAYSCSACMEELPVLKKVLREKEFKDKFKLIFIVIDADRNDLSDKEFPVYTSSNENYVRFPVPGTPTTYIITPDGKKLVYIVGAVTEKNLKMFLKQALKKYEKYKKDQKEQKAP